MIGTLLILALVALLLGALVWSLVSAWRHRRVDFIHRVPVGHHADEVADEIFDLVVPVLVADRYRMVAQAGHTTVFERRSMPWWTVLVAIFLFPFGLLALFARSTETITFVVAGGAFDVHGSCSKAHVDYIVDMADDVAGSVLLDS